MSFDDQISGIQYCKTVGNVRAKVEVNVAGLVFSDSWPVDTKIARMLACSTRNARELMKNGAVVMLTCTRPSW